MPNDIVNEDNEESLSPLEVRIQREISGDINYDEVQEVTTPTTSLPEDIIFFVSHGSNGEGALTEEHETVVSLAKEFREIHKLNVFFDEDNVTSAIDFELENALRRSRFAILICSPRYLTRYEEQFTRIRKEVTFFRDAEGTNQRVMIIPVLFGVSHDRFKQAMPLDVDRIYIYAQRPDEIKEIKVNELALKIIEKAKKMDSSWIPPLEQPEVPSSS